MDVGYLANLPESEGLSFGEGFNEVSVVVKGA